jgi:putative ABC transport system permease protein
MGRLLSAFSLRIPLRFLRGSFTRFLLTLLALACGVALVCAIDLTNRAVLQAFVEVVDTMAGRAALQVSAGRGARLPEAVATVVGRVPGVELAVPVVSALAFLADTSGETLTVHGVDITNEAAVRMYDARPEGGLALEDPLAFLAQPDSIALTRAFAERRGIASGASIDLDTPTGRRAFTVRGLLEPAGIAQAYGGNLLIMDLFAAEAAFTHPGFVNQVDVVVQRDEDVEEVATRIAAVLPAGLRVETPAQRKADLHRVMRSTQAMLQAVALLGLVAAFLISFNRLATVFERQARELGMLRAIGVRARDVRLTLLKQSLVLGVTGVALGIPLGIGLGHAILPVIATATSLVSKISGSDAALRVRPSSLVLAGVLGLATAVLAAVLPARRASRLAIAQTVHRGDLEQPGRAGVFMWLVRAVVAAAIGASIVLQTTTRAPEWGLLASGLIVIGIAMAARPLLDLVGSPVTIGLRWLAGASGRFATDTLLQNPRRTALTLATLGVGLGSVLWLLTMARSFERSLVEATPGVLRGDLAVSSARLAAGVVEAPIEETLLEQLAAVPGVGGVVGEQAIVDWLYEGGEVALNTFDPPYFTDARFGHWSIVGYSLPDAGAAVARGEAVFVSTNFVLHLGKGVGDEIELDTPTGPLRLRIAAVVPDFLSQRGSIIFSRQLYRQRWNDAQIVRALVVRTPGADLETLRSTIAQRLGRRYGLRILSLGELFAWLVGQVQRAFVSVYVLAGLVLVVVLVGVADTLAAGVLERTRQLGTIRAVGVRRRELRRIVFLEALLLAVMGLALAAAAGLALAGLWVKSTFPYLFGWILEMHIPYRQATLVVALAFAVCIAAALLPARRATRLNPAVALRDE